MPCLARVYFAIFAAVLILIQNINCAAVIIDNDQCSINCRTLTEFANGLSGPGANLTDDTTLILASGNHSLSSMLTVENVNSFSVVSQAGETWIQCTRQSVSFKFANVKFVKLMNLELSNCMGETAVFEFQYVHNALLNNCRVSSSKGTVINTYNSSIRVQSSVVENTTKRFERGVTFFNESNVTIENSFFLSNQAHNFAVVYAFNTSVQIIESVFENNKVEQVGIIQVHFSKGQFENVSILRSQCRFGVLHAFESSIKSQGKLNISFNVAVLSSVYLVRSQLNFTGELLFAKNSGAILLTNSDAIFSASCLFIHNMAKKRGGAITAIQSTLNFMGGARFENNSAGVGGAISVYESKLLITSEVVVVDNMAHDMGGGIYLYLSEMVCQGMCLVSSNTAEECGGGIHAFGSSIFIGGKVWRNLSSQRKQNASLKLSYNQAQFGGGLSLEAYSKVYGIGESGFPYHIEFLGNIASQYGGAVYVNDNSIPALCALIHPHSTSSECFLQTLYFTPSFGIRFLNNHASIDGSVLYGGLLDRCTINPFSNIFENRYLFSDGKDYNETLPLNALEYFQNVTNVSDLQTIASSAVRICFCFNEMLDCNTSINYTVNVIKGETFSLSLVAVNHVNRPVNATIFSKTNSVHGYVKGVQSERKISNVCTNLTFNVYSYENQSDCLILYAGGPCKDLGISKTKVNITFKDCTCPIGFELSENHLESECDCKCHRDISDFTSKCNQTIKSIFRKENFWIKHVDLNGYKGYLTYNECPFDYCKPPLPGMWINLETPDEQCAEYRTGTLCGMCKDGYSLSISSSKCMKCNSLYPLFTVLLILGQIVFGLLLVFVILYLNITVASGTINGILFYVNLVSTNSSIFLPFSRANPFTVLIAWLNLSIGFDACFYEGMNEYVRTWLLLGIPAYLISLIIFIILIGTYSPRFANFIGKKDPVATLATLLLLSYTKVLQAVIRTLSSTTLRYPDESIKAVWLPDANERYFERKHIPLFIVGVLITIIGLAYTILLFSWQWLVKLPRLWTTRWIRNAKLNSFVNAYHVPYTAAHRYWTGLLLMARIVLYILIDVYHDRSTHLFGVAFISFFLLVLKVMLGNQIYRKKFVNHLDSLSIVNILGLSLVNFYSFTNKNTKLREPAGYISAALATITCVIIVIYHLKSITCCIDILKAVRSTRQIHQPLSDREMVTNVVDVTSSEVSIAKEQSMESQEEIEHGNVIISNKPSVTSSKSNSLREPLLL